MVILGMMIHGTMTISSKKDYLSILGLSHDFDDKELKKAFRREARKWHPDLNKNDLNAEERFKLINEAYKYLSDPNVRKDSSDEKIQNHNEDNTFKTGFPDFQDYLDSLFGSLRYSYASLINLNLSSAFISFLFKSGCHFLASLLKAFLSSLLSKSGVKPKIDK